MLPAAQPTTKELFPALFAEILAVGRAIGLTEGQLPNNAGDLTIERTVVMVESGIKHIPSILLDMMNRRPIEVEGILGFLVKKGRSHNVAIPVSSLRLRLPSSPLFSETRDPLPNPVHPTSLTPKSGIIQCTVRKTLYPRL